MAQITLGIIGGGQLGSMLANAAKKLNIKTIIFCDDQNAPAKNYADKFIYSDYSDIEKIKQFLELVDVITFEFENIPFDSLNLMNNQKKVLPNPEVIKTRAVMRNSGGSRWDGIEDFSTALKL